MLPFEEKARPTNAKVFGSSLEERVLLGLCRLAGSERSSSGLFAGSSFGFGGLVIETKLATGFHTKDQHRASEL